MYFYFKCHYIVENLPFLMTKWQMHYIQDQQWKVNYDGYSKIENIFIFFIFKNILLDIRCYQNYIDGSWSGLA